MNEDRIATDETPDLSHWELDDEDLDGIAPRACVASFFPVPCKG